jgi:predicted nucleic acid-binding protein
VNEVFVDTSALLALLVPTDEAHTRAKQAFARLAAEETPLVTCSYTLVETYALVGRRLGRAAVAAFRADFAPLLDVIWVDADAHERGLDLLEASESSALSLVDAVSFVTARDRQIDRVFAFDPHFTGAGFTPVS